MQALRLARNLTRLVLVWFVLALGVAIASPLVQPQSMELVCASGGAMKLIVKNADGDSDGRGHTLDCPLCATVAALPVQQVQPELPALPALAPLVLPPVGVYISGRTAAPPPPRGPPSRS